MIISANQPYFIPYIAYWQLINLADIFLIADDYAYMNNGWVHRNRILQQGQPIFLGLELVHKSVNYCINETYIRPNSFSKKLRTIRYAYSSAPFFEAGMALMEKIFANKETNLSLFLEYSIKEICSYLGITTPIMRTSDLPGNSDYKCEQRVYDFCHRLGGEIYVNAIGGQELYHFAEFEQEGITLKFINSKCRSYTQLGNEFVPGLSILDVIMFNSAATIGEMLYEYSLIEAPQK